MDGSLSAQNLLDDFFEVGRGILVLMAFPDIGVLLQDAFEEKVGFDAARGGGGDIEFAGGLIAVFDQEPAAAFAGGG